MTPTIVYGLMLPLIFFQTKVLSALQYRQECFHETWYKYKVLPDDVLRKRNVLHLNCLLNYASLKFVNIKIVSALDWLVGCFGFNGPLRQYFSLYRAVSQREGERGEKEQMRVKMSKQPPPAPFCKRSRPLPYCNPDCRTARHWKFTQHHRTTRPPPFCPRYGRKYFHETWYKYKLLSVDAQRKRSVTLPFGGNNAL